jgi:hypothetical protein
VASKGATPFDKEKQTIEDLPPLKAEGIAMRDDLHGKAKYLDKDLVIRHQGNLQKAKKPKQPNKKTYLLRRHRVPKN